MRLIAQPHHLAAALLFLAFTDPAPASFDDSAVARFDYPTWFKTTFYDLEDDLADAREAGKRGIVLFYSTVGCSYCKQMLEGSFAEPGFAARLHERYDVVGLEIFSDSEITDWNGETRTLSEFAKDQGVQFSPTLAFHDTDGRRLLRLVGYYDTRFLNNALDYLDSGAAAKMSLREWLDRGDGASPAGTRSTQLTGDPLFASPPYQLDRSRQAAERPLLVLFEGSDCMPCADFHSQVLSEPAIRAALGNFELVRLDAGNDSSRLITPDGSAVTASAWHRALGFSHLPAIAVFDEEGREVVQTDALVLRGRFTNLLNYVLDRAYLRGWSYQRYARSESIRRMGERRTDAAKR